MHSGESLQCSVVNAEKTQEVCMASGCVPGSGGRRAGSGRRVNENTVSSRSELNHIFIADSLQLTSLTSRFGGAESFATSISLEKLDRSLSSFCPYLLR